MRTSLWVLLSMLALLAASCSSSGYQNRSVDKLEATSVTFSKCLGNESDVQNEISAARTEFNLAIQEEDADSIRRVLSENVVLVTGTDSISIIGRQEQLDIWNEDFNSTDPLIFNRTPSCIVGSNIYPIALEYGNWTGAKHNDDINSVSGEYSAKWRRKDEVWVIESETYMTTDCSGDLCPR